MLVFFSKQKTAYEMRISDWSSDVCSSDLHGEDVGAVAVDQFGERDVGRRPDIDRQPLRPRRQGHLHRGDRFGGGDMNRHSVDRKSVVSGKSVSVRVYLGGRRIIKKNNTNDYSNLLPSTPQDTTDNN